VTGPEKEAGEESGGTGSASTPQRLRDPRRKLLFTFGFVVSESLPMLVR